MTRTRQEIFDLAWNGLKAQGFRPSIDSDGSACMYRGVDGMRCAIGHCIDDSVYWSGMEGTGVRDSYTVRIAARIAEEDRSFAVDLQRCHDAVTACGEDMESNLRKFASRYALSVPAEATP